MLRLAKGRADHLADAERFLAAAEVSEGDPQAVQNNLQRAEVHTMPVLTLASEERGKLYGSRRDRCLAEGADRSQPVFRAVILGSSREFWLAALGRAREMAVWWVRAPDTFAAPR